MVKKRRIAEELIAEAEKECDFRAGIADIDDVLAGPSYRAAPKEVWKSSHLEKAAPWLSNARSLLVLAMHHPEDAPWLDRFENGNTAGNRRMTAISEKLAAWLLETHGVRAQPLPYHVEKGGVYLKDAAVFAGLGVIGKNNLLLDKVWGPRVRLRSVLIQAPLPAGVPIERFDPCRQCAMPCRNACPENAFARSRYDRSACIRRLESDRARPIESGRTNSEGSPVLAVEWCRRCEFTCSVGGE
ncbi:MAG: hypothetical protein R6U50_02920 [Desulfobacterales bacterium]